MPSTDRAHAAIGLRKCYAVYCTEIAYAATRRVGNERCAVLSAYARAVKTISSTEIACGAMYALRCLVLRYTICLRTCYAKCSTERAYGAYAAMRTPVMSERMVLGRERVARLHLRGQPQVPPYATPVLIHPHPAHSLRNIRYWPTFAAPSPLSLYAVAARCPVLTYGMILPAYLISRGG
eukprot:191631-Rhodomonas_salina.1